jgi:hypothetical protein
MPGLSTTPYDNAEYILQLMRSLGNDAAQTLAGNLLSDNQPYVVPMLNSAYRHLQRKLVLRGYQTLKKRTILTAVTAIGVLDPGAQVAISYSGYFNGVQNFANPALPADMLMPMKLKERRNGTTQQFQPMFIARDGLPSRKQGIWLTDWIWQNDQIQMCGAIQSNDLEILYAAFLPDLTLGNNPSLVLILRSENALGYYTLAKWAESRGSALTQNLFARGDECLKDILGAEGLYKQRGNTRRQPYSRRAHAGWGWT